jgi:outer membrane protein, heavy metal efflux system
MERVMNRSIVGVLIVLTGLTRARAAEPEPLDLRALLEEADRANPELLARVERAAALAEAGVRAATLPDPLLSVSYTNDGLSDLTLGESQFSNVTVRWEQDHPRKSARQLGAEVLRREQAVLVAGETGARARLRARVIAAYATLWRAERLREGVDESRATLQAALEAARARYESGEGSQEGVLRGQTEIRRKDIERVALERERRSAEIDLAETLGRKSDARFGPAAGLPEVVLPDPETLEANANASGPEIRAARAASDRAEAAIAEARALGKPEWGWMAAYQYLGSLDPMVMGGVSVRLPLRSSSNQARLVAERERAAAAARRDTEAAENTSVARVRDLVEEIASLDRQRTLLDEGLIPEGIATLEAARAAFSAGRAEMSLVLDDLARLLADRQTATDVAARRVVAAAELEAITGARIVLP